ncbi:MAG: hypothetical protein Kow0063_25520 [Anaerolineae bacterium]
MTRKILRQGQDQTSNLEHADIQGGEKPAGERHKAEIPTLLILPANALILHEDVDSRRVEPLVERLRIDGVLKNPPIAVSVETPTGHNGPRYVILDGANRTTALWKLEAPHHLVQVVDYHQVELDTWGHLVTGITQEMFFEALARTGLDLDLITRQDARERLARHEIVASIASPNGQVLAVPAHGSEPEILHRLTSVYNGQATIHRVTTDDLAELLPYYQDVAALVRFPRYTRDEILYLASNGYKLPTGITRHVIPGRALRVNLPLSVLMDAQQTTRQKNEWLHTWISHKLARREIRYYQESTFLFDE